MLSRNAPLRFLLCAFLSALVAVVTATISLPLLTLATGSALDGGIGTSFVGAVWVLPFAMIIGLPIAFPSACVFGGILLAIEKRSGVGINRIIWWLVGALTGILVAIFFGQNEPTWYSRIIIACWFAAAGFLGSATFHYYWTKWAR